MLTPKLGRCTWSTLFSIPLLVATVTSQLACDACQLACEADRQQRATKREARARLAALRLARAEQERRRPFAAPASYGSRASSRAAMPAWDSEERSRAPQVDVPAKAFEAARTLASKGLSPESLLICRVECRGACIWDGSVVTTLFTLGRSQKADLRATLSLGGETLAVGGTTSNGRPTHVSLPLAELRPGDPLRIDVVDVDPLQVEPMGHALLPVTTKLPLVFEHKHFGGRCFALGRAAIEERVVPLLLAASERLTKLGPALAEVLLHQIDGSALDAVRVALGRAAALVGWADPRVVAQLARLRQVLRAALPRLLGAVTTARPVLSPRLHAGGAKVRAVACGAATARLLTTLGARSDWTTVRRRGRRKARRSAAPATPAYPRGCLLWVRIERGAESFKINDLTRPVLIDALGRAVVLGPAWDVKRAEGRRPRRRNARGVGATKAGSKDLLLRPLTDPKTLELGAAPLGPPRLLYFPFLRSTCPAGLSAAQRFGCERRWSEWLPIDVAVQR